VSEDGRPLRVLVVNWLDRENPQAGGAEEHLHQVFGRIARRGHHVTALTSGWPGCEPGARLDGVEVHRAGRRYTFSLHAPRYFRRNLEGRDLDVIVEDLNKVPLFTPWWSDVPVVLLVHHLFGTTAFREANPLLAAATWLLERPVPRVFHGVPTIAVSDSTQRDLVRRGLDPERIDVVPNGVDVDHYTPLPAGAERFSEPTLLFLGRLKRYKRVDLVLRAVARLADRGREVTLRIAGAGDYADALRALSDRLGVDDRIHFEGFVTENRKLELLRRSWLHVLTSPKEGWGISNLEAAACGTPTVASDSPGLRESVRNGETGRLVPHGDLEALTDALERLLLDAETRERMAVEARRFAERFSWDAAAGQVLQVLRSTAGRTP